MGAGAHGGGGGEGVSEHPEKEGLTDHLVAPTLPSSQPVALLTMQHEAGPRGGHTCPSYPPLHVQRGLTCALGPAQSWVLGTQKGWRSPKCGTCNKEEPIRALRAPPQPRLGLEEQVEACSPNTQRARQAEGRAQRPGDRDLQVREATLLGLLCRVPLTCPPPTGELRLGLCHQFRPLEKSGREILTQPPPTQTGDDMSAAGARVPAYGSRYHVREHE